MIDLWRGEFGNTYHERNRFTPGEVAPVFERILADAEFNSVLEVGCGLGHNLAAVDASVKTGVEPNEQARAEARHTYPDIVFLNGDVRDLPFFDESFDVVLTVGLLIHVAPADIHKAILELTRVSRKYVACVEYSAVEEEETPYRGHRDVLWRRPFGKLFIAWGGMTLLAHDDADSLLYPGCSWWLLEK